MNQEEKITTFKNNLHLFFLFFVFLFCCIIFYTNQFMYLDGSRYYFKVLMHGGTYSAPNFWEFFRYSTRFLQLPALAAEELFGREYVNLRFYLYSFGYSFQFFLTSILSWKLLRLYKKEDYFIFNIFTFFIIYLSSVLFLQSISIETIGYTLPLLYIALLNNNQKWPLFLMRALAILLALGYETNLIILLTIFSITSFRYYKEKTKAMLTSSIWLGLMSALAIYSFYRTSSDQVLQSNVLGSLFLFFLPFRVWLWITLVPSLLIITNIVSERTKLILSILIGIFLTIGLYESFDIHLHHGSGFAEQALLDSFPPRVTIGFIMEAVVIFITFLTFKKYSISPFNRFITPTILGCFVMWFFVVNGAFEHLNSQKNIYNLTKDEKGCIFESDPFMLDRIKRQGVLPSFYPFYSINLQKSLKIDRILFGPVEGWGKYKGKMYKHNICNTFFNEAGDIRFTFFKEVDAHEQLFLGYGQLDFEPLIENLKEIEN